VVLSLIMLSFLLDLELMELITIGNLKILGVLIGVNKDTLNLPELVMMQVLVVSNKSHPTHIEYIIDDYSKI